MNEPISLADVLKPVSRTAMVDFRGVLFKVRFLSRAALTQIAQDSQVVSFDAKRRGRNASLDPEKYSRALGKALVVGWENLTFETLEQLVPVSYPPGMTQEALQMPVPFTEDNLHLLLSQVPDLDNFLLEAAMAPETFRVGTVDPETAEKNSASTSAGT